jgi:predicted Zn-dependent protease
LIALVTAALGAFAVAQAELPDWVRYVRANSGFSTAFFRPVELPGGAVLTRRTPQETVTDLATHIASNPDDALLYALRARESERLLDFAAADNDWNEFAARVADPAEGQLALADFYQRRLRPVDEVDALLAVGRGPTPPRERFLPPAQQRNWQAFERVVVVSQRHLLPERITEDAYRSWLARYSDQPTVYRRYLDFLISEQLFDASETLLADYSGAFPGDEFFAIQARAEIAEARDGASAALQLLEASFDPLWPPPLLESYFHTLEEADRLRERLDHAQQRIAMAPDDLSATAWVFHYRRRQGDQAGAIVALQQFMVSKEQRAVAWPASELRTASELFLRSNDYVDAARCRYALYSVPSATTADQEYALAGLVEIILDAPEQPIAVASGDFSYYRDIATADSGPGVLNGVLSLLLNSQGLDWRWQFKQRAGAPYQRRAWALELLQRLEVEFPNSEARSRLNAKAVRAFGVYGDDTAVIERGEQFLSRFPDAGERSEIQFLVAEAHARRGEVAEEFAAYERLLRELSQRFDQVPLGQAVVSTPRGLSYRSIRAPRSPDYARVLDRYVSRLVSLQRVPDAVRLYVIQVAANPDDPGIYERMASFLQSNRLADRVEGVYRQAIAQFDDASWSHKLGRWYLRQQRQAEFEQLTHEVVDSFAGTDLDGYFDAVAAGPGISDQLYLRLNQYAHERFPHNLTFVRNLLSGYRRRATRDIPAWRALIRQHWFYTDDLRRQYFADLTESGQLETTLAAARAQIEGASDDRWDDAARANPAGVQLIAEAEIWRASFEQAAAPALAIATLAPSDEPIANRTASLHRSLAAYDPAHTESAITLTDGRLESEPGSRALLAEAGDILADRGRLAQAVPYWDRMATAAPGDPQSYLSSATVYWDYYLFDQAIGQLNEGRQQLDDRALFSYEAGAIEEGRNNSSGAIREYLQGALNTPPNYQSRQRLVTLARRDDYRDQIDQATASLTASESPSRQAIELRIAVLQGTDLSDELEEFLVAVASRVDSRSLLEHIEQVAQSHGSDAAEVTALLRRIEMTNDPVEARRLRIWLAQRYESFGNDAAAEQVSSQLYAEHGRIEGVVRERTDLLWRNDKQDQAIAVLLESAGLAYPTLANTLRFEAAQKASEAARYEQAESILSSLLTAAPFHAGYTAAMADLIARQGRDDALAKFYESQIAAVEEANLPAGSARTIIASLRRGMIPALDRLGRSTEALDQYIELVNRFPEDEALTREAAYYAQDHDLGEQLASYYLRTTEQSPRDVRYHRVLARIETDLEHFPEAVAAYGSALAVLPNDIDLWRERTRLQERLLLLEDALVGYRTLYELSYQAPEWMLATARVHARRGDAEEAVAAARAALIAARPEQPSGYFSGARHLAEWGFLEDAFGLAARGVALSGDRLLDDQSAGAQLYIEIAAQLRLHQDAVERVLASRPAEPYDGWEYKLQSQFEQLTETASEYFSPAEEQQLISYLNNLRSRLDGDAYEHALLPAVTSHGPAELETRWLADDLTSAPANGDEIRKRARLIELQQRRMRHAELGRQLEAHWRAHPRRNQEAQLLDQAAAAFRVAGESGNEFRLLEIRANAGAWQERYADLLLERNPTALLSIAARSNQTRADRTAEYLILQGDADLAWRAVEARATNRAAVWEQTYKGLAGALHTSSDARFDSAYVSALGNATIGDRIGQPVDRDQQLAGQVWFYHAARYGEHRASIGAASPEDYLVAEIELRPASSAMHSSLADIYREYGDDDRAEAAYQIAVELDENEPLNYVRLGELAFASNNPTTGIEHWRQALAAYTSQIERSRLGPNFWKETAALFEHISAQDNLSELRSEADALLQLYVARSGAFRFGELAKALLSAGYTTAELLDICAKSANAAQLIAVLANANWLDQQSRAAAHSQAITVAEQQLGDAPRPQQDNLRYALLQRQYDFIEFLLDAGNSARAQLIATDLRESMSSDRPALYYRLGALAGNTSNLFTATSPYAQEQAVHDAVQRLRGTGANAEANSLLEAFYRQRLLSRSFSPSYFLGLAGLYLERGAVDDAEQLLRRMTTLSAEPYASNLDAATLLANAGQTQPALSFAADKLRAEPWHAEARLVVARLSTDSQGLATVARDSSVPYKLRVDAAKGLAESGGINESLGSRELDMLARGAAAPTANPAQPSFYYARLAAPSDANLLADALSIRPQASNDDGRLRLFDAARADGDHHRAIVALEPTLTNGQLGQSLQSYDSTFSENPSRRTADEWTVANFLSTVELSTAQRAAVATNLSESLARTERRNVAAYVLDIAIALEDTPQRRQSRQTLSAEINRRAENARRRPRIGDHLDQPSIVRPQVVAGGQQ